MANDKLYYGDNLDVLRRHIPDESVDLVYLDPPFNSNATYNVLFGSQDGTQAAAQIKAFEDTWRWDQAASEAYHETVERGGRVADALVAFRTLVGDSNMLAYLAMMAPRLVELRRVLKDTGSIYLHCDPTASHYLKLLMDAVFGPDNFQNEVIWKRTGSHGSARRWGPIHDTILFYSRSSAMIWNPVYQDYDPEYIEGYYRFQDERGKYRLVTLTGAGVRTGDSGKPWREVDPTDAGRHWAVPLAALRAVTDGPIDSLTTQEKLDILDAAGLIYWPPRGSVPQQKRYLDEAPGVQVQDIVTDIRPISSQAQERLGYPTQKPEALLDRIIEASCGEGGVVLDPFCGCGTTIASAQRLNRRWIGIDVTYLAISLIKSRLADSYGDAIEGTYTVIGEPTTLEDARALAEQDRHQFEWWALGLVEARPEEGKKGADRGIDGRLFFGDEGPKGPTKKVILSVKSGSTGVAHVRDLVGVLDREQAQIGVLITLQEPTAPMKREAASAGFYTSPWDRENYPRVQVLTVEELLAGARIRMPAVRGMNVTYKRAREAPRKVAEQQLELEEGS